MLSGKGVTRYILRVPWWIYVLLAALVYSLMKYAAPLIQSESAVLMSFARGAPTFAPLVSMVFLLLAPIVLYEGTERQEWVGEQQDLSDTIGDEWQTPDGESGNDNAVEDRDKA